MLYTRLVSVAALATASASAALNSDTLLRAARQHVTLLSDELNAAAHTLQISGATSSQELQVFQDRISASKHSIDALQSTIQPHSKEFTRAQVACQVAKLVFPKVIASNDSDYQTERDENWYVTWFTFYEKHLLTHLDLVGRKHVGCLPRVSSDRKTHLKLRPH
jgi:hypothetical protein